jgi:hypothetical protein
MFLPTTFTMVNPLAPAPEALENFKNHLGHGYSRKLTVFTLTSKGFDEGVYAILSWKSTNKKGEKRMTNAALFEIMCDPSDIGEGLTAPDVIETLPNDERIRYIKCPQSIDKILKGKDARFQLAHAFSTNDMAGFDSFTVGQDNGQFIERWVIGNNKNSYNEKCTLDNAAEELFQYATTAKRVCPYMLESVLEQKGNDTRFDYGIPDGLSDEELKLHKEAKRAEVLPKVTAVGADEFKRLYLQQLQLNKTLPMDTEPAVIKDKVGGKLIILPKDLPGWNALGPLLFLLATLRQMQSNPRNLVIAGTCLDSAIFEVSKNDKRYGIIPLDGQKLDILDTSEGRQWLVEITKTHGLAQREFCEKLRCNVNKARDTRFDRELCKQYENEIMDMLTHGLNEFQYGILGLVKHIALLMTLERVQGGIKLTSGVERAINKLLEENGIGGDTRVYEVILNIIPVSEDDPGDVGCIKDSFEFLVQLGEPEPAE